MGRHKCATILVVLGLCSASWGQFGLPPGFAATELISNGLTTPTCMCVAPDGTIYIAQQAGAVRIWREGTGLLPTQFFANAPLSVDSTGERGLIGMALDPSFGSNRYIYVHYTMATTPRHARLSRFTADAAGNLAVPGSEAILLELNTLSATNHNGGAMHFGPDGMLYVGVGENAVGTNSQSIDNLCGKILRIRPVPGDIIPLDNPTSFPGIVGSPTGNNRAIWAVGLRNPFTFAFQPGTGRMLINDVGSSHEEIDEGLSGQNYGWPSTNGPFIPSDFPDFTQPFYAYNRVQGPITGACIAGGVFYNPASAPYPPDYYGDYFFADYSSKWIRRLDMTTRNVTNFAWQAGSVVDLEIDAQGRVLFLRRGTPASIWRLDYSLPSTNCGAQETAELFPISPAGVMDFGQASAISDATAVITAPSEQNETGTYVGAAYVYVRETDSWSLQAKITASDGVPGDRFGNAVALDGDTLVIAAREDDNPTSYDAGAVYVYSRHGVTWTEQSKLSPPDAASSDFFGSTVALSGDTIVVGSPQDDTEFGQNAGSVHVFVRNGDTWTWHSRLVAADAGPFHLFGWSVAISGQTIIVGAMMGSGQAGAAYIFAMDNGAWTQQARLGASNGSSYDYFGTSVALSGDTAVIGAYGDDFYSYQDAGAAYVFARTGNTWLETARLYDPDPMSNDWFGFPIVLSSDTILVGVSRRYQYVGGPSAGEAIVFRRSASGWVLRDRIIASDSAANDGFGTSVAISGNSAIIGAPRGNGPSALDYGTAYLFDFSPILMTGDMNDDGALNTIDIALLIDVLIGADLDSSHIARADTNCNGQADGRDVPPFVHLLLGN